MLTPALPCPPARGRLLASLAHPNLTTFYEAFVDGGKLCIVQVGGLVGRWVGVAYPLRWEAEGQRCDARERIACAQERRARACSRAPTAVACRSTATPQELVGGGDIAGLIARRAANFMHFSEGQVGGWVGGAHMLRAGC